MPRSMSSLTRTHTLPESDTPMLNQEDIQLASFDLEKTAM